MEGAVENLCKGLEAKSLTHFGNFKKVLCGWKLVAGEETCREMSLERRNSGQLVS